MTDASTMPRTPSGEGAAELLAPAPRPLSRRSTPCSASGAYVIFVMEEGQDRVLAMPRRSSAALSIAAALDEVVRG